MAVSEANLEIYKLLYHHRKTIFGFTLFMALASILFTQPYFITPLYKAEAILSPAGTNSAKIFIEHDPKFGADKEIDEQTQILQSAMVRDSMIRKFNLVSRYDIDTSTPNGIYNLYKEYDKSVYVDRTRYGSISVRVFDRDARQAADMANALVTIGDKVKNSIIKKNMAQVFKSIEREYFEKGKVLDAKAAEVNRLLKKQLASGSLIRSKGQVEQLKEQIDIKSIIQQLQLSGVQLNQLLLLEEYDKILQEYLDMQSNYEQAFANANSDVPPSYIISPAEMINKKAFPPRSWLIVLSTISSFILACAALVAAERLSALYSRIRD